MAEQQNNSQQQQQNTQDSERERDEWAAKQQALLDALTGRKD